jgi:hypothetical protein
MNMDDLSAEYQQHRQNFAGQADGNALLDEVLGSQAEAMPVVDPVGEVEGSASTAEPSTASSIAADIGEGIIETPVQVVGGMSDAGRETFEALGSVADWLNENVADLEIEGGTGIEALDRPLDALAGLMPDIDEADSVTGGMVRSVAQFLGGFVGAGKFIPGKGLVPSMAKGAVADATVFDPHEDRLSNMIEEVPELENPVSEFLAADPNDSEAMGRFKNALEGLGLGALTEGVVRGVKAVRAARRGNRVGVVEPPELRSTHGGELGDLNAPWVSHDAGTIDINFARINSPDDVKLTMQELANRNFDEIDKARRGKRTHAETEAAADEIDAFDVLLNKRDADPSVTKPLTAEETVAARRLWTTSAEKLLDLAEKAAANPSEANLFNFRRMVAVHEAVQKEVLSVRAETARALDAWKIPAGGGKEQMRGIENALESMGGADVSRELAGRIAALRGGSLVNLDAVVSRSVGARTRDAVIEGWIMGLLSGPKTHLVNTMSNTSVIFLQMLERGTAARIGKLLGTKGGVELGEGMAQWHGAVSGLKDAFIFAGRALKSGESGFGLGKIDTPRQGAISSEAFNMASDTWTGRAVDFIGSTARIPGRLLSAEDEFFKTIGYRMELHARSLRQASQEVHAGKIEPDNLKTRIAELVENPPEDLRLAATDAALYQTFTNKTGKFADGLRKVADADPSGFARVLLPFVRTPSNIMKFTFERTLLAPLMSQVRADIAAGGARSDLALARMATGSGVMLATADMAMGGAITGGGSDNASRRSAMMRQGWQPYSVKTGDRYYAYNRMDPVGMTMGLAADLVEILQNSDGANAPEVEEAMIAVTASIASNVTSKTYMRGVSEFFEMMSDPDRYAEGYVQRLLGTVVPRVAAEAARIEDPYLRESHSIVERIRSQTPGISKKLPAIRDLWGKPIEFRSGLGWAYDAVSPIYSKKENPNAIDTEIIDLGMNLRKPPRTVGIDGFSINLDKYPGAYQRYVELSGNELKHPAWGIGAFDNLNAIVKGNHPLSSVYEMKSDGPDGGKVDFIRDTVLQYRELARQQLKEEFPGIAAQVNTLRLDALNAVM